MSPAKTATLLSIATELRLEICDLVLADFDIKTAAVARRENTATLNRGDQDALLEPPLLQVCKLLREESVGTFNKRLSAMLEERRDVVEAAEAAVEDAQRRYRISRTAYSVLVVQGACAEAHEAHEDLLAATELIEEKREKLRKEGFEI